MAGKPIQFARFRSPQLRSAWRSAARLMGVVSLISGMLILAPLSVGADATDATAATDAQAQAILGNWLTGKRDGIVRITREPDGLYQGRIVGGSGPHRLDEKNPDVTRRQQPLLGQVIMRGMRYEGSGRWSGGSIYDPDSGHTYRCLLQLLGADRLRVRGFLGVSLLGRTQIWMRYTGTSMTLPTLPAP